VYPDESRAVWYDAETDVVLRRGGSDLSPEEAGFEVHAIQYNVPLDAALFEIPEETYDLEEGSYERGRNATPELLAALSFSPLFADEGVLGLNLDATYILTETKPFNGDWNGFKNEYLIHYLSSHPKWVRVYQDVGEHLKVPRDVRGAEFENLSREEVTVRGKRGELYVLDDSPTEGKYYNLWWREVEGEYEPLPGGDSRIIREAVLVHVAARGLTRDEVLQLAESLHP
jgi:hypothetical protein